MRLTTSRRAALDGQSVIASTARVVDACDEHLPIRADPHGRASLVQRRFYGGGDRRANGTHPARANGTELVSHRRRGYASSSGVVGGREPRDFVLADCDQLENLFNATAGNQSKCRGRPSRVGIFVLGW